MKVVRILAGEFGSNCWLVFDEATHDAVIIDPSPNVRKIKEILLERRVNLRCILLTHGHFDHMLACDTLRDEYGIPLAIHEADKENLTNSRLNAYRLFMGTDLVFRPAEITFRDGDVLDYGSVSIRVMHTPGHTPGSVCYFIDDAMFTGDTIFDGGIGRCDLAGGNRREMKNSIEKIKNLKENYRVFTGHGSVSTLEKQKEFNEYLIDPSLI